MRPPARDRLKTDEAAARLQSLADAAARTAANAARFLRQRAQERAPSGDDVLRGLGLERRRPVWRRRIYWPFVVGAVAGGAVVFLLDPIAGRRRRAQLRGRAYGAFRDASRILGRGSRAAEAQAHGLSKKVTHLRSDQIAPARDAALVDRVLSEAFRGVDPDLKERINVNAVGGIVFLRGEFENPQDVAALVERVRRIRGVREIENLLRVRGAPAPSNP